jgi:hypothetical protein
MSLGSLRLLDKVWPGLPDVAHAPGNSPGRGLTSPKIGILDLGDCSTLDLPEPAVPEILA